MKLGRLFTMGVLGHHGDVNITSKMLNEYGSRFSSVEIEAMSFLFMAKRLLWKPGKQASWRKSTMKVLKKIDDATVHKSDWARTNLGGEAIFILTK